MVGTRLTQLLLLKNYQVCHLSRSSSGPTGVKVFVWDVDKGYIESGTFDGVDAIVHLAGAGVAEKRWTEARKQEILDSRTKSSDLIIQELEKTTMKPKAFISASAIGVYGFDTGEAWINENSKQGKDFLAQVTQAWEAHVEPVEALGLRLLKFRIGVVLSKGGGALEKIRKPIMLGAGAPLGTGKQLMSWIHIDDLCRLIIYGIENQELKGVFNAVASTPETNDDFTQTVAKIEKKPLILPNVPAFALKLLLGEMANIVLGGNRVSNQKIRDAGFDFQFEDLENALLDVLKK